MAINLSDRCPPRRSPISASASGSTLRQSPGPPASDRRRRFDPAARHGRSAREIERHVQSLVRAAEHVRDQGFLFSVLPELTALRWSTEKTRPTLPAEKFVEGARPYRERFRQDGVGVFEAPYVRAQPADPQGRRNRSVDSLGRRARRLARCVCVGRARRAEGSRGGRAAAGRRRAARPQRPAARHDRSPGIVLQRLWRGAGRPRVHRLRAAQSVSRRGPLSLARSQGQHHPRDALLVHPRAARADPRLARDRCPSWTRAASRSTA